MALSEIGTFGYRRATVCVFEQVLGGFRFFKGSTEKKLKKQFEDLQAWLGTAQPWFKVLKIFGLRLGFIESKIKWGYGLIC